jgi:hypothetical protein
MTRICALRTFATAKKDALMLTAARTAWLTVHARKESAIPSSDALYSSLKEPATTEIPAQRTIFALQVTVCPEYQRNHAHDQPPFSFGGRGK